MIKEVLKYSMMRQQGGTFKIWVLYRVERARYGEGTFYRDSTPYGYAGHVYTSFFATSYRLYLN